MATRQYWKYLALLLLCEWTSAKTVTRHEIITKSNGDKIERTWSTNDGEDAQEFDQHLTPMIQQSGIDLSELQKKFEKFDKSKTTPKQTPIIDAAITTELLRTKEPIVQTFVDPDDGLKHTTTYFMTPAGGFGYSTKIEMPPTLSVSTSKVPISSVLWNQQASEPKWHNPEEFEKDDKELESPSSFGGVLQPAWRMQRLQPTGHSFVSNAHPIQWSQANAIFEDAAKDNDDAKIPLAKVLPGNRAHITWHTEPTQYFSSSSSSSFSGPTSSWPQISWFHHTSNADNSPQLSPPATKTLEAESKEKTLRPAKYPGKPLHQLISELYVTTTAAPRTSTRPITTISVDDLPVTEILQNGKPVDESFLKSLPDFLRPAGHNVNSTKRKTIKIENIPMTKRADDSSTTPPTVISSTTASSAKLPAKGFSSSTDNESNNSARPIIKYHDPFASDEDTTTTGNRRIPIPIEFETPPPLIIVPPHGRVGIISSTTAKTTTTPVPKQSNIANFLRKLGLNIDDVILQNGQTLTKTIVDDDGRILTASFMLSSVKGLEDSKKAESKIEEKPLK